MIRVFTVDRTTIFKYVINAYIGRETMNYGHVTTGSPFESDLNDLVYRASYNKNRSILVVSDSDEDRDALSTLMRMEGFQVFSCKDKESAREIWSSKPINAVVASIEAEESTLLLQDIRHNFLGIATFVIAREQTTDQVVDLMRAGAYDIIKRPINTERLTASIREVMRRDTQILPPVAGKRKVVIRGFPVLTPREREVLQFLVDGLTNKEIGISLDISARTVEVHRARVLEKLGARNTADLIRIALTT